jgi:hypothetical protein
MYADSLSPARIQETAQNTLTDEVKGIFCQACAKVAELAP